VGVVRPGAGTQRDWGTYGLGSAVAGRLIAFFPAVVPAALVLWCLGLIWGAGSWRRRRSGHGLAGLIAASLAFAYMMVGIAVGLAFF
jgi:hypothetical protein